MRSLVFDTSSIITLVMNDLLWTLKPLRKKFNGDFCIPTSVKYELVDNPLHTKKFKFEAIRICKTIEEGDIHIHESLNVDNLLKDVNNMFTINGNPLHILDKGEIEALALAIDIGAEAYVVDERTMRVLIEDPFALKRILMKKIHTRVDMDKKLVDDFSKMVKGIKVLRSAELILVAYEQGILNNYLTSNNTRYDLLDGILWALKLRGCSISMEEIEKLSKYESSNK